MTQEYQPPAIVKQLEQIEQEEFWECSECEDGLMREHTKIILNDERIICNNCLLEQSLKEFIDNHVRKVEREKH